MYSILFHAIKLICFHSVIVVIKPITNRTVYELIKDIKSADEVSLIISGYISIFIKPIVKNPILMPTLNNNKTPKKQTLKRKYFYCKICPQNVLLIIILLVLTIIYGEKERRI